MTNTYDEHEDDDNTFVILRPEAVLRTAKENVRVLDAIHLWMDKHISVSLRAVTDMLVEQESRDLPDPAAWANRMRDAMESRITHMVRKVQHTHRDTALWHIIGGPDDAHIEDDVADERQIVRTENMSRDEFDEVLSRHQTRIDEAKAGAATMEALMLATFGRKPSNSYRSIEPNPARHERG
jgi:hypothetical protein